MERLSNGGEQIESAHTKSWGVLLNGSSTEKSLDKVNLISLFRSVRVRCRHIGSDTIGTNTHDLFRKRPQTSATEERPAPQFQWSPSKKLECVLPSSVEVASSERGQGPRPHEFLLGCRPRVVRLRRQWPGFVAPSPRLFEGLPRPSALGFGVGQ